MRRRVQGKKKKEKKKWEKKEEKNPVSERILRINSVHDRGGEMNGENGEEESEERHAWHKKDIITWSGDTNTSGTSFSYLYDGSPQPELEKEAIAVFRR